MKTPLKLFWLAAVLAVGACQARPAGPAQPPVQAAQVAVAGVGAPLAAPTIVPAADLSAGNASFPGLYFTGEQIATGGEGSVRVLSARPCAELLDVLSAGEWRATQRLELPPSQFQFPSLLLLERGESMALAKAESVHPLTTTVTAEANPLTVGEQCRAQVTEMHAQPVEAAGAESAQGEAWIYPFVGGCRTMVAGTLAVLDVGLLYEGPGDFRAVLRMVLASPVPMGEQDLGAEELSLTVFRSEQSYFDILGEGYAQMRAGQEMNPQAMENARSFEAASETPGTLNVTSSAPLEGEINLTQLVDETGATETFRAGIQCNE